ncbi:MAG TPA: universal stress protein [Polyangiales bacterium]|nr:universal stress protein [Polyangiales bacterium]
MTKPFQKILVPIDFSPHTKRVLEVTGELCRRYEAPIMLLHVREPELFSVVESYQLHDVSKLPAMREHLMNMLEVTRDALQAAGAIQVNLALTEGRPAPAIARFAEQGGFDLIVMGTHGRRGLSHALLGSVTEEVIRRAHCAVMTVRLQARNASPTHVMAAS